MRAPPTINLFDNVDGLRSFLIIIREDAFETATPMQFRTQSLVIFATQLSRRLAPFAAASLLDATDFRSQINVRFLNSSAATLTASPGAECTTHRMTKLFSSGLRGIC